MIVSKYKNREIQHNKKNIGCSYLIHAISFNVKHIRILHILLQSSLEKIVFFDLRLKIWGIQTS
jgi:hypothetical protein